MTSACVDPTAMPPKVCKVLDDGGTQLQRLADAKAEWREFVESELLPELENIKSRTKAIAGLAWPIWMSKCDTFSRRAVPIVHKKSTYIHKCFANYFMPGYNNNCNKFSREIIFHVLLFPVALKHHMSVTEMVA